MPPGQQRPALTATTFRGQAWWSVRSGSGDQLPVLTASEPLVDDALAELGLTLIDLDPPLVPEPSVKTADVQLRMGLMTDEQLPRQAGPVVSVRGSARLEVEPDSMQLLAVLRADGDAKAAALQAAANALNTLTAALADLGGVRRTVQTASSTLTWLARSSSTQAEQSPDPTTGQWAPTGRFLATVPLTIGLRDFDRIEALAVVLAGHDDVETQQVAWRVDETNPHWRQVRADAIAAAVRQARDYAAALGGELQTIEHVSDVGLLGGAGGDAPRSGGWTATALVGQPTGSGDVPPLDPEPQQITATIEARFTTTGVLLAGQ